MVQQQSEKVGHRLAQGDGSLGLFCVFTHEKENNYEEILEEAS